MSSPGSVSGLASPGMRNSDVCLPSRSCDDLQDVTAAGLRQRAIARHVLERGGVGLDRGAQHRRAGDRLCAQLHLVRGGVDRGGDLRGIAVERSDLRVIAVRREVARL